MSDRLTKQGMRDLNAAGHNGRVGCRHWFGALVQIGTRWAVDPDYGDEYEEPVYGQKCLWCSTSKERS